MLLPSGIGLEERLSFNVVFIGSAASIESTPVSFQIPETGNEDFDEIITLIYKRIANIVNTKEGALYDFNEVATFQQFFSSQPFVYRPTYRKVVDCGALPGAGLSKTVAHGIPFNSNYTVTHIFGASSDPTALQYIPLPYVDSVNPGFDVGVWVDGNNVNLNSAANRISFTRTIVVIEYMKII